MSSMNLLIDPSVSAGASFIKLCGKSKPHPRDVRIDTEKRVVSWKSPRKAEKKTSIAFYEIKEVRSGQQTDRFKRVSSQKLDPDCSFSVVYGGSFRTLDLVAKSKEVADTWVAALRLVQEEEKKADPIAVFLKDAWKKADKNADGKLDLDEILKLLHVLNVHLTKSQVKNSFNEVKGTDGTLDFAAFTKFYKNLKFRKEIEAIFLGIAKEDPHRVSPSELKEFLTNVQKVAMDEEEVKKLIIKYGGDEQNPEPSALSLEGFSKLLVAEGNPSNPQHLELYQDMTQPLTHYWINSSHNTYLLQDQLRGPSSTEAYVRALQRGCRCVELDCWDGPDGKPIVYHGHTLVSKILFEDVIKVVKEYAFKVSPYPVILSLEVHTNVAQQDEMAAILKNHLGSMISSEPLPDDAAFLPSPESLKNKILIKSKGLSKEKLKEWKEMHAEKKKADYESEEEEDEDEDETNEAKELKKTQGKSSEKGKIKFSYELAAMVNYCKTAHFKGFDECREKGKPDTMSSFVEGKSLKMSHHHRNEYIEYNRKQLSRIYPAGGRVDSSNYDPHLHWNSGCQIVALNYQTPDRAMQLNLGKFAYNNHSGYLLKPEWMRREGGARSQPKKLTIQIISAQQLPKPHQSTKGEIIDPFVEVEIVGEPEDSVMKKTKHINDNGFNPVWENEVFEFSIKSPDLTLVRIAVFDKDLEKDDFIAYAVLNFESLQEGYRHIQLTDSKHTLLTLSYVFVKISITPA